MPMYRFKCPVCNEESNHFQSLADFNSGTAMPTHCSFEMDRLPSLPSVISDVKPFRSMMSGDIMASRSQYREELKKHGCVEVGNETMKPDNIVRGDFNVRRELTQAVNRVLDRG